MSYFRFKGKKGKLVTKVNLFMTEKKINNFFFDLINLRAVKCLQLLGRLPFLPLTLRVLLKSRFSYTQTKQDLRSPPLL